MAWMLLVGAIVSEVFGTMSLRLAVDRRPWYAGVALGYVSAFTLLSLALSHGIPLGAAYGIWVAAGVALTALLGRVVFKEPFTWLMGLGVALIIGGVLLIETGAA
ncbi:QacE family quaternary ammonium compound efflux SMR transporter [Brachybacterium halotolerans subsp. kimchii]|uniref:DMT family transporter n=1 Tax=Brachybacterium halotolerans TaxID=2795215 RepID=UPI001E4B85B2|nr:SMR family transporter [Brachybacterium halotolerans]UEJ81814.1 QacE family quaternary ammonium compound efflux SMR transporter [Brachybacterium halotolerans subsp. kimchii]